MMLEGILKGCHVEGRCRGIGSDLDLHDGAGIGSVARQDGLGSAVGIGRVHLCSSHRWIRGRGRLPVRRCTGSASGRQTCEKSTITSARSAGANNSECWSTLPTSKRVGSMIQVVGCWPSTTTGAGRKPPSVPIAPSQVQVG